MLAHIVGIPVEETALGFAPVAALGVAGIMLARQRLYDAARNFERSMRRHGARAR